MAISEFTMKNRSSYIECPKDVIFQGSNDGSNWTDIISFEFCSGAAMGITKTVQIPNPSQYLYYRWYEETVNADYGVITVLDVTFAGGAISETW